MAGIAHVHESDQAQDEVVALAVAGHGENLPLEHAVGMMAAPVHGHKNLRIERVEAHRHAAETAEEFRRAAPQKGFAAGDARLADPAADEGDDDAVELGQPQEPVRARNAQVAHRAPGKIEG